MKVYVFENLERQRQYSKKYYHTHKEEEKIRTKKRSAKIKEYKARYELKHKEKIKERHKIWQTNHPERVKEHNTNRISFKGENTPLDHNPRKGICNNCKRTVTSGEIKITNLHHIKYDPNNPLAYTIELCVGCHNSIHSKKKVYISDNMVTTDPKIAKKEKAKWEFDIE